MNNIDYPPKATLTGDLALVSLDRDIALSRSRLLIDTKVGERVMQPDYGVFVSPFNTSNADFDDSMINFQVQKYCLDNLASKIEVSVGYDPQDQILKYTLQVS